VCANDFVTSLEHPLLRWTASELWWLEYCHSCCLLCCVRQLCTAACTQMCAVLNLYLVRLVFVFFCKCLVCIFVSSVLDHFGFMLLVSFVGFSFFSTKPKGWLGRMSPKSLLGCKMLLHWSQVWMSICVLLSLTVAADVCYQALYPLVLSKILCVLWHWLMFSIFSNAVLLYPYLMLCWLFWQLCSFYLNMSNIVLISHALAQYGWVCGRSLFLPQQWQWWICRFSVAI